MTRRMISLALCMGVTASAWAADLQVSVSSNGRGAVRVPPATTIEFLVLIEPADGELPDAAGLDPSRLLARLEGPRDVSVVETRLLNVTASDGLSGPVAWGAFAAPDAPGVYRLGIETTDATRIASTDLTIEVAADAVAVVGSDPPSDAIDARQPASPDGARVDGWDRVVLLFSDKPGDLTPADFAVEVAPAGRAPQIDRVTIDGQRATLHFDAVVPLGAWTRIVHLASGTGARLGHLPGDVNASRRVTAYDILALLDHLDGVVELPAHQTDVDRNGRVDANDVVRLLDLINGWSGYAPFLDRALPGE